MSESPAFELLHEGVRRQLYKMGWPSLRSLQEKSIRHILTTNGHAILSAGTAAGKTEAAFLPVLSAIADEVEGSIRAVYVGPLKALINDQFARVEELCGHIDVPVHRWHGDVIASDKAKLIKAPGGVLLITPESLESLFVNRSNSLSKLFRGLRFVVIDELHSFLDNERGLHLRSLLYRLALLTERPLRLLGLSATIGDPLIAKKYIDRENPETVCWVEGDAAIAELKLRLHAYIRETEDEILSRCEGDADQPARHARDIASDIVEHCHGNSNLIFANSRNDVEEYGELCQRLAVAKGYPDRFLVHHGSLSAGIRQETEETMKESSREGAAATAFCTRTLEMGIDIGSVKMVGQIGAPNSVSSLKQRVGRSGRRKDSSRILRIYLPCDRVDEHSDFFARLHLDLIQTIAVTELLLKGWVEPAEPCSFDLSTLTQQIISMIAETGARQAKDLFLILCKDGAFSEVESSIFGMLLRQLAHEDIIEQTVPGDIILGLKGEDLRKDKGFYAAFPTQDAFVVLYDGQRIGTVDNAPAIHQHMILGGRRWKVADVDDRQLVVYVIPASGWKGSPFAGDGGVLHPKIVAEMHSVLGSSKTYVYLDKNAESLLKDARHTAAVSGVCTQKLITLDVKRTVLVTWAGTRTMDTLGAMFKTGGIEANNEKIGLVIPKSVADCAILLQELCLYPPTDLSILETLAGPPPAKYDALLGTQLLQETKSRRWMDKSNALALLRT